MKENKTSIIVGGGHHSVVTAAENALKNNFIEVIKPNQIDRFGGKTFDMSFNIAKHCLDAPMLEPVDGEIQNNYLTGMPLSVNKYGFSKVLAVRKAVIHVKHIMTEIFVRKTIDIEAQLKKVDWSLFDYITFLTQRLRKVHKFSRTFIQDPNKIVTRNQNNFFPFIEIHKGLNNVIVLDFDGVITKNNFRKLYNLCIERGKVFVCTANPTVNDEWFIKHDLPLPSKIYANKGKIKKLKRLIEIQKKYDMIFYVDNETEYLDFAWLFGIYTYHFRNGKIFNHSLNTK